MEPGLPQGSLATLQDHCLGAAGRFAAVGLQGTGHRALGIGKQRPAERLVEVNMGVDQGRQGQGQRGCRRRWGEGPDGGEALGTELELHRQQAFGITGGQRCTARQGRGLEQGPRNTHRQLVEPHQCSCAGEAACV